VSATFEAETIEPTIICELRSYAISKTYTLWLFHLISYYSDNGEAS
jgi:hypothetical protein